MTSPTTLNTIHSIYMKIASSIKPDETASKKELKKANFNDKQIEVMDTDGPDGRPDGYVSYEEFQKGLEKLAAQNVDVIKVNVEGAAYEIRTELIKEAQKLRSDAGKCFEGRENDQDICNPENLGRRFNSLVRKLPVKPSGAKMPQATSKPVSPSRAVEETGLAVIRFIKKVVGEDAQKKLEEGRTGDASSYKEGASDLVTVGRAIIITQEAVTFLKENDYEVEKTEQALGEAKETHAKTVIIAIEVGNDTRERLKDEKISKYYSKFILIT